MNMVPTATARVVVTGTGATMSSMVVNGGRGCVHVPPPQAPSLVATVGTSAISRVVFHIERLNLGKSFFTIYFFIRVSSIRSLYCAHFHVLCTVYFSIYTDL